MPGRADGDGVTAKGNAMKRDLDDALRVGLGAGNPDAKRRHTAAVPGRRHDESTFNLSSFHSSGHDVKRNGPSKSSQAGLDDSPTPQAHRSLKQPNSSVPTAKASGAPGLTGALGGTWGAKPNLLGGLLSGPGHHRSKQHRLSDGPPTSSSTSSDASSIPPGYTATLPTAPSKDIPQTSFHSLRYGYKPATPANAVESNPRTNDRPGQEAQSQDNEYVATGPKGRQYDAQDNIRPASRLKGKRKTPYYDKEPSDDGPYVVLDDEDSNINDDENAAAFSKTRQGSARPIARGSSGSLLKVSPDVGLDGEHNIRHLSYDKTPSGKDYHNFNENWKRRRASFALFPDEYRLNRVPGLRGFHFFCPVRTCPKHFNMLKKLDEHFKIFHQRSEFNDNLDQEGTLELIGQRRDSIPGEESIIVSRNPRRPSVLTNSASTSQTTKTHSPVEAATTATAMAQPIRSYGLKAVTVNKASKESSYLRIDSSSSSEDDGQEIDFANPTELDRAMAESKVWARVAPLVPQTWAASINDGLETSAFIQAISLPLRNEMDMEWLAGTKNSHQRIFRALMSIIFQVIGVEAHCKPCDSRHPARQRNCKVLPPEAASMRELQEVCGSQCVNCYFFHATKPCEFPTSSATAKQTPVPVPIPPVMRPMPNIERSLGPPCATYAPPPPAASRTNAPSYSSYKATKADKPISESPVPIPLFASRGPSSQRHSQLMSDVSSGKPATEALRRSVRAFKKDSGSGVSSSTNDSYTTDEGETHSAASAALSAIPPSNSLLASGELGTKESTAVTSDLSSGDTTRSRLVGIAFNLFGDIGKLPVGDQAILWNQMQQMAGMLQMGTSATTNASGIPSISPSLPPIHSAAAAEEWEIAPGRLTMDDKYLAFSTSFLSREIVSAKAAQQLSPTQRVLNKSIAALNQLSVGQEEGWDCTCSVIRGVLKMRVGDVEARIGQGGVIIVEKECIITNVSHKEARIQVWWKKADD